jgi:hypothetical protein
MKKILLSAAVLALAFVACKKDEPTTPSPTPTAKTAPVVTTTAVTSITATTAMSGVTVTSDGGATITAKGIVWSTATAPTTALGTKTTDGTGVITGLTVDTKYYVRAYATNSVGTSYGAEVSFTTVAGDTVAGDTVVVNTALPAGTGDILITEFQTENTATEFVEIYNASGKSLNLINYTINELSVDVDGKISYGQNYWLDTDDPDGKKRHSDTTNTAGRVMAAGEYLVLVDDSKSLLDLVTKYPSFDSTKAVVVANIILSNGTTGDEIAIRYQSAFGANYVVEDQMNWNDTDDLLSSFGGSVPDKTTSDTHQRTDLSGSADDATKWKVASATPGLANN